MATYCFVQKSLKSPLFVLELSRSFTTVSAEQIEVKSEKNLTGADFQKHFIVLDYVTLKIMCIMSLI